MQQRERNSWKKTGALSAERLVIGPLNIEEDHLSIEEKIKNLERQSLSLATGAKTCLYPIPAKKKR